MADPTVTKDKAPNLDKRNNPRLESLLDVDASIWDTTSFGRLK